MKKEYEILFTPAKIIKVETRSARYGAKIVVKEGSTWERDILQRNAGRR